RTINPPFGVRRRTGKSVQFLQWSSDSSLQKRQIRDLGGRETVRSRGANSLRTNLPHLTRRPISFMSRPNRDRLPLRRFHDRELNSSQNVQEGQERRHG